MKKLNKILLILIVTLVVGFTLISCGDKPDNSNQTTEYTVTTSKLENGVVESNVTTAKKGDTVNLTVTSDLGYKLKDGSLKANDKVVSNNTFVMPEENVVVTAEFVVDGEELTVEQTGLDFSVKHKEITATAHVTTVFNEETLTVKYVVEDQFLPIRKDDRGDAVKLYLSKYVDSSDYLANNTYLISVYANKKVVKNVYDGEKFVDSNVNVNTNVTYFAKNGKLGGYVVEISVPYSVWGLTKETAKGTITMLPMVYNNNSTTTGVNANFAYPQNYNISVGNHNSMMIVEDSNVYAVNDNVFPGYYFKNDGSIVLTGEYWNVDNDKKNSSGDVVLSGHDNADNNLLFNVSSTEFMYARATITLTDLLNNEAWSKIGMMLFDGSDSNGIFYYADLAASSGKFDGITGNAYGVAHRDGGWTKFTGVDSPVLVNLDTKSFTLELIYNNDHVYFFADGKLVHSSYYQAKTDKLGMGIKSFSLCAKLTNYYCTADINDTNIASTLALLSGKTNASLQTADYGQFIDTVLRDNPNVGIKYAAVNNGGKTYIRTIITTPTLPVQQSNENGWYNWTNFEFHINDKQLYVAIAGNMNGLADPYHVFAAYNQGHVGSETDKYTVYAVNSSIVAESGKYVITLDVLVNGVGEDATLRFNYAVMNGVRCGVVDDKVYTISGEGLSTPQHSTDGGYYFANDGSIVSTGAHWDITNDTENSSGEVVLTGYDNTDNNLLFNVSSTEFMYAKTTLKVTGFLNSDPFPKVGMMLFDGSAANGVFYYVDLVAIPEANNLSQINGNHFGVVYQNDGWIKWNDIDSQQRFNKDTMTVTLEMVYINGMVYFFADGNLVQASYYNAKTSGLAIGVKSFNLALSLTDYYCTDNSSDSKIASTLAKINTPVSLTKYGNSVDTVLTDEYSGVEVSYSAIYKDGNTYIRTVITTPSLLREQSNENGWYNWTNFEFRIADQQLFVAIAANMNDANDPYHIFTNNNVKGIYSSFETTNNGKYQITVDLLVSGFSENSTIKFAYSVINGVRCGVVDDRLYTITSEGLVLLA